MPPEELRGTDHENGCKTAPDDLTVYFQFFWRIFRGYKVVVCTDIQCSRYDPFAEKLSRYSGTVREAYFDFNWNNMHKKTIGYIVGDYLNEIGTDKTTLVLAYENIMITAMEYLAIAVNGNVVYRGEDIDKEFMDQDYGWGQKYAIDLFFTKAGGDLARYDPKIEYTVSVENCVLSILTPHSALIPQGIVIFKGFSTTVWLFVLATFILFIVTQYIFQYSQREWFYSFYSEAQVDYFAGMSATLTIFSYFMCGGPPSLHLGRLFTGKILFFIFSFSALVISTVFLSNMTILLTDRVRYPEIDSFDDLAKSELVVQATEKATIFITSEGRNEGLKGSLIQTYEFYVENIFSDYELNFENQSLDHPDTSTMSLSSGSTPETHEYVDMFMKNLRRIEDEDAFLVMVPSLLFAHRDVQMQNWIIGQQPTEFHLCKENLAKFPFLFPILRNSFLFDRFDQILYRLFENGHVANIFRHILADTAIGTKPSRIPECEPLRPYSLNDLQAAFIFLGAGLVCSFIAFMAELLSDFFRISLVSIHLRSFSVYLLKKIKS
ncbi:unnamed protein product [Bemisia tabaci]|uniref:Ionotropic glutamate receptor C-terminal domain-containing protein n=1 Tax=Bemisia tabaci TaxID=7038 RepID=A0A9P0A413_BEMTA|nr:unnamed protein product [Bemisia tabaci]